jgi:ribosomal protein S18 acetylase RimI-like enzyme
VGARVGLREVSTRGVAAAELAARGMADDPMVVKVFGADPAKRLRRLAHFYAKIVRFIRGRGELRGAFERGTLVGVIGTMRPGFCQPGTLDAVRILPTLVANLSPAAAMRLKHWIDEWARHDPREDHWHVGLLSVEPHVQGFGVGTKLIAEHCAHMDEAATVSYLETDKASNVRFYQRFGYGVIGQASVLGVTNWFMKRLPVRALWTL